MTVVANVRYVTAQDETIWRDLWRCYLAFYETKRDEEVYAETWQRINDPHEQMFSMVAENAEGLVIGIANFLHHQHFWSRQNYIYLTDLYVCAHARSMGAGKAMIDAVVNHAKVHNCEQVWWFTAENNITARKLYDGVATLSPFVKYQI